MTNYEKLKEMSPDELSSLLCNRACTMCIHQDVECKGNRACSCKLGIKDWLLTEVPRTHEIKLRKKHCDDVYSGERKFEIRPDEGVRGKYRVGDYIKFIPISNQLLEIKHPIAEKTYKITYASRNENGLHANYAIFEFEESEDEND